MIYVTVGTGIGGGAFDRLIKTMDDMAPGIGHKVVAQIGASNYIPGNMEWFRFVSYERSYEYFKSAAVVVGHCGSGTVINALSCGTPLVVVPRKARWDEHTDDHQMGMARFLEDNGLAKVIYDIGNLEGAIKIILRASSGQKKPFVSEQKQNLIKGVKNFLLSVKR